MNFLAHYVLATRFLPAIDVLPLYVVGNALPDLLPPQTPRFRPQLLEAALPQTPQEAAVRNGVSLHLATDAAFHKTAAFAEAQADAARLLQEAGFVGIRVRGFFVAHVLVELALDAALLRADAALADGFYRHFGVADLTSVAAWTQRALNRPLPALPGLLARFGSHQYLRRYADDEGVAEGLTRVCARARQDTFEGDNFSRLVRVVEQTVAVVAGMRSNLLDETARGLGIP